MLTKTQAQEVALGKNKLITKKMVAHKLNVAVSTFEKWVRAGKFSQPVIHLNGYPRWLNSQLVDWFKDQVPHKA